MKKTIGHETLRHETWDDWMSRVPQSRVPRQKTDNES